MSRKAKNLHPMSVRLPKDLIEFISTNASASNRFPSQQLQHFISMIQFLKIHHVEMFNAISNSISNGEVVNETFIAINQ